MVKPGCNHNVAGNPGMKEINENEDVYFTDKFILG